jgi:hypothetical protein
MPKSSLIRFKEEISSKETVLVVSQFTDPPILQTRVFFSNVG